MSFNCGKIIISGYNLEGTVLNRYYQSILHTLSENLPADWTQNHPQQRLRIVPSQSFTQQVLNDKSNVGICLAQTGVLESADLNQKIGIRAALVHNRYLAEMCRKHNDANVMIISTDCIAEKLTGQLVLSYLKSAFDNEQRNMIRVTLLGELGEKYLTEKK